MKFARAPVAAADSRPSRRREGEAARRARSPRPEDSLECNARRAPARLSWSMREVGPLITQAGQRQGRVSLRVCPYARPGPVRAVPGRKGRCGDRSRRGGQSKRAKASMSGGGGGARGKAV